MRFRLSVILSIFLTQNLFANEDFITIKGLNVSMSIEQIESILTKKGYECHRVKGEYEGITDINSYCFQGEDKGIVVEYHTNIFTGFDGQPTEVYTVWKIMFDCESLNACGRGEELADLLVRKYKLIHITGTNLNKHNKYHDQTNQTPFLYYIDKNYRNPNNNDVLIYDPDSSVAIIQIVPYKYESEKLKKMKKRKKKQIEESFDLD